MRSVDLWQVTRRFRRTVAIDRVSLSADAGSIVGVAGLPCAGKTTLMRLISGLERPTSGRIEVLGGIPLSGAVRARIGLAPGAELLDDTMTTEGLLVRMIRLKGFGRTAAQERGEGLIEALDLVSVSSRRVGELPVSSRQLLCAAVAFAGDAELVLLDGILCKMEGPDTALLHKLLLRATDREHTVLLAARPLSSLGAMCDEIALLDRGRLLGTASPDSIRSSVRGLLFKYEVPGACPVSQDREGIQARWTGSVTEILADRDLSADLTRIAGAADVREVQPTFTEACSWVLRHPEAMAVRSRLGSRDAPARLPITD